jgi:hypothetical protein
MYSIDFQPIVFDLNENISSHLEFLRVCLSKFLITRNVELFNTFNYHFTSIIVIKKNLNQRKFSLWCCYFWMFWLWSYHWKFLAVLLMHWVIFLGLISLCCNFFFFLRHTKKLLNIVVPWEMILSILRSNRKSLKPKILSLAISLRLYFTPISFYQVWDFV